MKVGKHLSLISILVASIFIIKKAFFDIETYRILTTELESGNGDIQPTLVAGGIKVAILYLIPISISLILSVIGMRRKNKFGKSGVILNLIAIVYHLIPLSLFFFAIK